MTEFEIVKTINRKIFNPAGYSIAVTDADAYVKIISDTTNKIILTYTEGIKPFLIKDVNQTYETIFGHINWLKQQDSYWLPPGLRIFAKSMPEMPDILTHCSSFEELELKLTAIYGI